MFGTVYCRLGNFRVCKMVAILQSIDLFALFSISVWWQSVSPDITLEDAWLFCIHVSLSVGNNCEHFFNSSSASRMCRLTAKFAYLNKYLSHEWQQPLKKGHNSSIKYAIILPIKLDLLCMPINTILNIYSYWMKTLYVNLLSAQGVFKIKSA